MSLIITNSLNNAPLNARETGSYESHEDLRALDRYLNVIEDNRRSCQFVPNDVAVALDMAGYVRGTLRGETGGARLSAARLALALAQTCATSQ